MLESGHGHPQKPHAHGRLAGQRAFPQDSQVAKTSKIAQRPGITQQTAQNLSWIEHVHLPINGFMRVPTCADYKNPFPA
jgi:hypothetical protein